MSGAPGAGERARELAAQLDLLEYGPEHRGFYDIEGATKLIEKVLTEAIEAAEFATEKDCLKVVQKAYYEAYAKSDRLNMRVCAEIEKYMKESRGEHHLAGALAAVRLEGERQGKANAHANALHDYFASMKELDFDWIEYHRTELTRAGERAVEGK